MPAIDAEVCIGGKDDRISQGFGHANKAGIGKAHRDIRIFLQEGEHFGYMLVHMERGYDGAAAKQRTQPGSTTTLEKMLTRISHTK